jgi:hypothetical protein
MPYVAEKVVDMLYNLLTRVNAEEGKEGDFKGIEDCSIDDFQKLLM